MSHDFVRGQYVGQSGALSEVAPRASITQEWTTHWDLEERKWVIHLSVYPLYQGMLHQLSL